VRRAGLALGVDGGKALVHPVTLSPRESICKVLGEVGERSEQVVMYAARLVAGTCNAGRLSREQRRSSFVCRFRLSQLLGIL
jgi:hypothetical protein